MTRDNLFYIQGPYQLAKSFEAIGNQDQASADRPALEPRQPAHRPRIQGIAAQSVTGLGRVGDQSAAP